ncbi:putative translation protein, beta-barrel domain superfamily [Plasmopara halstedii]
MSRHRNVRNRAYSYEDEDYDEYYDDNEPHSPNSNEFMYRRDSPSHQQSIFSFVQQEEIEYVPDIKVSNAQIDEVKDGEILAKMVPKVQEIVSNEVSIQEITQELRRENYDLDKTVVNLLERNKVSSSELPLEIEISRLEAIAIAIDNEKREELKRKKEIIMPAPVKGKAVTIRGTFSTLEKTEDENQSRVFVATESAISRAQTQFSAAEKNAFERAELKTQEEALKLEEVARTRGKTKISMVVIGHVDAGKSTITGHLLYKLGYVSKRLMHKYEKESQEAGKSSFAYAWVMDADEEERSRAAQADVALLVVPAVTGEFEAAFENSGQTKEHTLLVRSLGVSQMIVAVNKMDMVHWDKDRFDMIVKSLSTFLQGVGFRLKNLRFVPLSGITGVNLETTNGIEECAWYSGPSLVDAIDTFSPPQRQITKPFRMTVSDVSKSMSLGQTISGRVYTGAVAVGNSFLLMPIGEALTVKGMEQDGKTCTLARAGDTIEMGVSGIDPSALTTGSILCSIASPVQLAQRFEAKIMTMPAVEVPIVKGTSVTIHMHNIDEPGNITRLVSVLTKTGEVEKKKPRCISRERSAVIQITAKRKICLEVFANYRQLGRFTLRDRGKTLAAGIVTQIFT